MNERIKKLAIDSNMLNYVDNETPRYYFLNGYADEFDLEKFANLIIQECANIADDWVNNEDNGKNLVSDKLKKHFGIE